MSRIDELTIKGVRSFSHEEEQKLTFLQPLTVITGHNGAGKTTIIECLRYACSGCFPPGAQNSCFVHDLKKAGKDVVEGSVDLRFKDKASNEIKVTRYFKAFQKRSSTKIEFLSLPPTIERFNNEGTVISSSTHKLKDLTEEMVNGLGVSQTIMVNVIFCHQDESNWPLSDGKHLKEKFDELFGATRYNKALERIKLLQKEWNKTVSLLQKDAHNYKEWKKEAEQETEKLKRKQSELDNAKGIVDSCRCSLEPKQKKLQEIKEKESHFQELEVTIRALTARKNDIQSSCKVYQDYCDNNNETDLARVIRKKKKIKAKKDNAYYQLEEKLSGLTQQEKKLQIKAVQLMQDQQNLDNLKETLQDCVNEMAAADSDSEYIVNWDEESSLKSSLENFQWRFRKVKEQLETQLDNIKKQMLELIHHEKADVEFLRKEKQKMETSREDIVLNYSQEVVQLLGVIPECDWYRQLEEFHRDQKESIENTNESLYSKKIEQCRKKCIEKQILEKLEKKKRKLKDMEERLNIDCGVETSSSTQTRKDDSPPTTFSNMDVTCALCSRTFTGNETEKQSILQIMKAKLPPTLKDTSMEGQQLTQEWENIFKEHRTTYIKDKIAKLSQKVIPHLEEELKPARTQLIELESDIRKEEETLKQHKENENLAAKLIPKISVFDYLVKGVRKCTNAIKAFKKQQKSEEGKRRLEYDQKKLEKKINILSEGLTTLKNYVKDLDRYTSVREDLITNTSQLKEIQQQIGGVCRQMKDLKQIIDQFEKSIVKNRDKVKYLQECKLYLKKKSLEKEEVEQQLYTAIEDQRNAVQSLAPTETTEQLRAEILDLEKKKSKADGKIEGLEKDIESLEEKLSETRFCHVDDKLRECVIDLKTTKVANSDLEKYYKALDWAIIQFHKIKMEEINRIAKEYWTKIYKGSDIDYIEIRSESSSETSARRSYNYRVVMVSNGKEMDMRGRCSAGQKVLASLIIRLALAETFCLSCGILALDEPTANLDFENKKGLASALAQLIEDKKDSNFQLIVITHDEAFVEMLGGSGYADHFYRVTKDSNENSIINRKNMSDLHS